MYQPWCTVLVESKVLARCSTRPEACVGGGDSAVGVLVKAQCWRELGCWWRRGSLTLAGQRSPWSIPAAAVFPHNTPTYFIHHAARTPSPARPRPPRTFHLAATPATARIWSLPEATHRRRWGRAMRVVDGCQPLLSSSSSSRSRSLARRTSSSKTNSSCSWRG